MSFVLLPGYFHGDHDCGAPSNGASARARRFTSLIFMVTRVMAASVRLRSRDPDAPILHVPVWVATILARRRRSTRTSAASRRWIWIDLIQVIVYISGAVMALWVLLNGFGGDLMGKKI